jgi:hypothetical protein
VKAEVTEHQMIERECPCCRERTRADAPDRVTAPVQYGPRAAALGTYRWHGQFLFRDQACVVLQRPGCANAARIECTALARRDRVIAARPALLQDQPQLRDGNALKEAAVHVPAHDQVTDQRPRIPLSARRGAIPLTGPDLPDELHIALADGVKGVHGASFLRPPPGTQCSGPLRPVRYPMRRTGRSEPAREVTAGQRSCEPIRRSAPS